MVGAIMRKIIPLVVLIATVGACAGARGTVAFDHLKYPVSSSAFVYAPDGQPITVGPGLAPVGAIDEDVRLWGIVYSWVPLTGTKDISELINARIAAAAGEGVINLALHVSNCGINYIPILNWLPIYPGCTYVRVTGTIVKLAAGAPPPPPNAFIPAGAAVQARVATLTP
jgi:hypothetical protein